MTGKRELESEVQNIVLTRAKHARTWLLNLDEEEDLAAVSRSDNSPSVVQTLEYGRGEGGRGIASQRDSLHVGAGAGRTLDVKALLRGDPRVSRLSGNRTG